MLHTMSGNPLFGLKRHIHQRLKVIQIADLGWHIFRGGEAKLVTDRLKVIGRRSPNVNDFDSSLIKDVVNKGVTLLSVLSLVGSVVQLNRQVWHERSGIHENKIYSFEVDPIVKGSSRIKVV